MASVSIFDKEKNDMKGITNATKGSADVIQDASKVQILDMEIQSATDSRPGIMTAADHQSLTATKSELNALKDSVGDAIIPIDFSRTQDGKLFINMESLDGQENSIEIPVASVKYNGLVDSGTYMIMQGVIIAMGEGYYTYDSDIDAIYPSVDNSTIHYNSDKCLEVIGGGSSDKKFVEEDMNCSSPGTLLNFLVKLPVGTMVTIYLFGKTSSSPCGTLTGIVKSVTESPSKKISITYTGGNFYNGSEIVIIGGINYNVQPYFNIGMGDGVELWIPEVKGNSVHGATYTMSSSFQGYSVAVFN